MIYIIINSQTNSCYNFAHYERKLEAITLKVLEKKSIVALDFSTQDQALSFVDKIDPSLCALKVGSEMFTLYGADFVRLLVNKGYRIFLDLKFHDIPNTVAKACEAAAKLNVWMLTVHASGGQSMMKAARLALDSCPEPRPLLVAVTVLTSMDAEELKAIGVGRSLEEQVVTLALDALNAGCDAVVCSAEEVPLIKAACGKGFLTVTPGIRFEKDKKDDQSRVVTPEKALQLGSDYLVLGRTIIHAAEPAKLLRSLVEGCP